jgi:hypothetical protein
LHRREYTALIQNAPFNDYIDANKNGILDGNEVSHKGVGGGYNMHTVGNPEAGGGKWSKKGGNVDVSSAGCAVFADQQEFLGFMSMIKGTQKYQANKNCTFDYLLVDSDNFEFYNELKALAQ